MTSRIQYVESPISSIVLSIMFGLLAILTGVRIILGVTFLWESLDLILLGLFAFASGMHAMRAAMLRFMERSKPH